MCDFELHAGDADWSKTLAAEHPEAFVSPSRECVLEPSELQLSPVSHTLPTTGFSSRRLAIAGEIRLHNRADLLRDLGAPESDFRSTDDSEIVLAAYAKWGEECAGRLLGEFSFAVWDEPRKRLFCCRDQIGARAFYYWHRGSRFIFSSDTRLILKCPGVSRVLNRTKLAALAVQGGQHFYPRDTFHAGIFSLPGGSWMIVEKSGIHESQYWTLRREDVPDVPRRPDEAMEQLREILFQAVECRLDPRNPVAAFLSGGLDSSAVVAIAARCLEKKNRRLTAISAVLPEEARKLVPDEKGYADEFASWSNIGIESVTAEGRGPFDSLDNPQHFEKQPLWSGVRYLMEECQKAGARTGARVMLSGEGGEYGPTSWSQRYYLELAVTLRWSTLARELNKVQATRGSSRFRTMAGPLADILFPSRNFQPGALFTREFMRECRVKARRSHWPFVNRWLENEIRFRLSKHAQTGVSASDPIEISTPLLDKRVLEFCLALPADLRVRNGYQRYPIRGALAGVLPERIRWRTSKTPFAPDFDLRFNAQLPTAKEFIASIPKHDPVRTIVDVPALEQALTPLNIDPARPSLQSRGRLTSSLYLICFLRQFSEFRF